MGHSVTALLGSDGAWSARRERRCNGMGRMKDLQVEPHNLMRDWESLVERILGQPSIGSAVCVETGRAADPKGRNFRNIVGHGLARREHASYCYCELVIHLLSCLVHIWKSLPGANGPRSAQECMTRRVQCSSRIWKRLGRRIQAQRRIRRARWQLTSYRLLAARRDLVDGLSGFLIARPRGAG